MNTSLFRLNLIISYVIFTLLVITGCDWPFNTNTSDEDIFELTLSHDIVRVMPSETLNLIWSEITVENFKYYKIERMRTKDTSWTPVTELSDAFQLSFIDTIWDDDDLLYRIGIFDSDDNIIWATSSISIPKTTRTVIPNEFETIQPAFESELMDDGDTIFVRAGIYPETLGIAGKDVLIKSIEGFKTTILQPTLTEDPNEMQRVLSISSGIIEGFSISLGAPSHGALGGGIAVAQNGTVQNCYIDGNQSQGGGGGIFLTDNGNLYNNIISNNFAGAGSGIFISSAHGEIINNTIFNNDIVINGDCTGLILRNNIIYNSQPDISFTDQDSQSGVTIDYSLLVNDIGIGTDIIIADPLFNNFTDFKLSPTSPCIDTGHPGDQYLDRDGSRNDRGAYGGPGSE